MTISNTINQLKAAKQRLQQSINQIQQGTVRTQAPDCSNPVLHLQESILNIDDKIESIQSGRSIVTTSSSDACRYMKRKCSCKRSNKANVDKIKCLHPEAGKDKTWVACRTSEKCSIRPVYDSSGNPSYTEDGIGQYCKYYEPLTIDN